MASEENKNIIYCIILANIHDQLDWLKSMTNTTGVLHILTGTYELLPLRNLNGQAARRGLEIHFPRYQFQHEPDQLAFQRIGP